MLDTELHQLLVPFIDAPVECDGFTRLAHTALSNAGIEHTCMMGRVVSLDGKTRSPIHFWIELEDGRLIDYRARMWLGDCKNVPHGVFQPVHFKSWVYQGEVIDLPVLHPVMANILMQAIPLPQRHAAQVEL